MTNTSRPRRGERLWKEEPLQDDVQDSDEATGIEQQDVQDLIGQPAACADDQALMARYQQDYSAAAFAAIHERFEPQLTKLVTRRLRGTAAAFLNQVDDLVQQAFLNFYRKRETFPRGTLLEPLLLRIAENVVKNFLAAQTAAKRDYRMTKPLSALMDTDKEECEDQQGRGCRDPKERLIRAAEQASQGLREMMEFLPPNLRMVLGLKLDGYTDEEVAELMGTTLSTAKWWIKDAKDRLRNLGSA